MRLTADLISRSAVFMNTLGDREVDLRGNKLGVIENLGVTQDEYDTIDLSDNEIVIMDNFPLLRRLRTLFLNNNKIRRVRSCGDSLPNLEVLMLAGNDISELGDVAPLSECASLHMLSLLDNPVTRKSNYRLWMIHHMPQLRVLDFRRVKGAERGAAKALFAGDEGAQLAAEMGVSSAMTEEEQRQLADMGDDDDEEEEGEQGGSGNGDASTATGKRERKHLAAAAKSGTKRRLEETGADADMKAKIMEAISRAKTMEEVSALERALQSGKVTKELLDFIAEGQNKKGKSDDAAKSNAQAADE